jgi:hypothetical protein
MRPLEQLAIGLACRGGRPLAGHDERLVHSADSGASFAGVGTAGGATFGSPTFDEIAMAFASTMAPGWVRTELGGPDAALGIEESVPSLVNVLVSKLGTPGLHYLDRLGGAVPW